MVRRTIIALAGFATAACSQPHSDREKALLEELLAPSRKIAARAAQPDAEVVLQAYDPARDQVAATECKAAYTMLLYTPLGASIPPEDQRRLQIHGRVAYHRIEALTGKPQGTYEQRVNDERFIDVEAYLKRHNYDFHDSSATPEEKADTLDRVRPTIALCDKALAAWRAPEIDEKPHRDYVENQFERFQHIDADGPASTAYTKSQVTRSKPSPGP